MGNAYKGGWMLTEGDYILCFEEIADDLFLENWHVLPLTHSTKITQIGMMLGNHKL